MPQPSVDYLSILDGNDKRREAAPEPTTQQQSVDYLSILDGGASQPVQSEPASTTSIYDRREKISSGPVQQTPFGPIQEGSVEGYQPQPLHPAVAKEQYRQREALRDRAILDGNEDARRELAFAEMVEALPPDRRAAFLNAQYDLPTPQELGGTAPALTDFDRFVLAAQIPVAKISTELGANLGLALGDNPDRRFFGVGPTIGELSRTSVENQRLLSDVPPDTTAGAIAQGIGTAGGQVSTLVAGGGLPNIAGRLSAGAGAKLIGPELAKRAGQNFAARLALAAPGFEAANLLSDAAAGRLSPSEALTATAASPVTIPVGLAQAPVSAAANIASGDLERVATGIGELGAVGLIAAPAVRKAVGRGSVPRETANRVPEQSRVVEQAPPSPVVETKPVQATPKEPAKSVEAHKVPPEDKGKDYSKAYELIAVDYGAKPSSGKGFTSKHIKSALSSFGIDTKFYRSDPKRLAGITFGKSYPDTVFLNENLSRMELVKTAAHEASHLIYQKNKDLGRKLREKFPNDIAFKTPKKGQGLSKEQMSEEGVVTFIESMMELPDVWRALRNGNASFVKVPDSGSKAKIKQAQRRKEFVQIMLENIPSPVESKTNLHQSRPSVINPSVDLPPQGLASASTKEIRAYDSDAKRAIENVKTRAEVPDTTGTVLGMNMAKIPFPSKETREAVIEDVKASVAKTAERARELKQQGLIQSSVETVKSAARWALGESKDNLNSYGESGSRLGQKIESANIGARIDAQESYVRVADALSSAGVGKYKGRKFLNELNEKIEDGKPLTDVEKAVHDVTVAEHTRLAEFFNAVGGRVLDPKTGPRPLSVGRFDFVPQKLKPEILQKLVDGKERTKDEARRHLVESGQASDWAEAKLILDEYFNPQFNGFFAGVELPRKILWPKEWRETRYDKVWEGYFRSAWKRAHEIAEFGQDRDGATLRSLLQGIQQDAGIRAREKAQTIYEENFGLRGQESYWAYVEGNITNATKLINFLNGTLQASQAAATASAFGVRRSAKAAYDLTTKPDARKYVRLSGAVQEDYLRNLSALEREGVFTTLTRAGLTAQGTPFIDGAMRRHAAHTALIYGNDAIQNIASNPKSSTAKAQQRTLERMGFEKERIDQWVKDGKIPDRDARELMIRGTRFTQFENDPLTRPVWSHSNAGRVALRLKNFAIHQARFLQNEVYGEAKNGNLKPLVALLAGWGLASEAYTAVKNWALGRERTDKDLQEIVSSADWQAGLERLLNDWLEAGTFGIISDSVIRDKDGNLRGRSIRDMILPPVVMTADRVYDAMKDTFSPLINDEDDRTVFESFIQESKDLARKEIVGLGRAMEAIERRNGTFDLPDELPTSPATLEFFNMRRDLMDRGGGKELNQAMTRARKSIKLTGLGASEETVSTQTQRANKKIERAADKGMTRAKADELLSVISPAYSRIQSLLNIKRDAKTEREKKEVDKSIERISQEALKRLKEKQAQENNRGN